MMYDFSNKAYLVTGSTRGIGRAIAEALASAGATVGIHGRSDEKVHCVCDELSKSGKHVIPSPADLSDPESAADLVRKFARVTGHINGLVNNAGAGKAASFRAMSLEKWRATFSINLEKFSFSFKSFQLKILTFSVFISTDQTHKLVILPKTDHPSIIPCFPSFLF